ncbi:putative Permease [Rhodovulum sp. PH10]|uniref:LPS export ABC transporter permease LptG n=1 Tax=Rhodovulum sp. PH10 TaxID=1187851 RepID=UPI00027C2363|nr:LPS export ABC transporter permease LptG [Rhodovulum sp. PH10]EJW11874.1 putative Permease [Rhodovulum sp. PH10]
MIGGRLARYFGRRFLSASLTVFVGVFGLVVLVDYIELMRRSAGEANATALLAAGISLTRVPQIMERILPFAVLVGAMMCYLNLSRRLELVVARSAGMSAWQFVTPAVVVALGIGAFATMVYNPVAAALQEQSKRLEDQAFNNAQQSSLQATGTGFWVRQKSVDGQSIVNAATSADQGVRLGGVTVFMYDHTGRFVERVEAKAAVLEEGHWRLIEARRYPVDAPPQVLPTYQIQTNLTLAQVRETFATPETVSFWDLPFFIEMAEHAGLAAAGYRLQYQKLISRPALLAAMVLVAAAFSLRFFRFGGVQKMVLAGVLAGFSLYVLSKVTEDLSKAELLNPVVAAWLPVTIGVLTGLVPLLYQEDG